MDAPPATPRQRLAAALADRYRLERELGQGGMATVYLAQDLKHDRRVAVKVLKPELAAVLGAERFVQEIRTTAALQHPHILPLFDSGTAGGFLYYVMPFIDGETLRSKLDRETQLGIDESVRTTASVADALDYAHRHGVIHRDIKPENILLHDGRPMVADFGIALAVSAAAGGRMTETGLSLGTPHYMSPEQATAEKEITARSDIYSLGSVLYEMLTGSPPHVGASAQQIIMKIVTEEAEPVTKLRKAVPPHVAAAVATALEKLPADRFTTAREFAEALESPGYARTRALAGVAPPAAAGRWRTAAIVCGTAAIALALLAAWSWRRPAPPPVVSRYGLAFPDSSVPQGMALSDDGRRLVFAVAGPNGEARLALKERNQDVATTIPGTERPQGFAVSPDGESVAFVQNASLRRVSLAGGSAVTLADSVLFAGIAWLDDNTIAYTTTGFELRRIPAGGGRASLLWNRAPPNRAPAMPFALPGNRGILFTLCNATCDGSDLWVYDLRADSARKLVPGVLRGYYLPGGQLAWVGHDGVMRAAPFDLGHLELRGNPVPLVNGIALLGGVVPNLVFSRSGTMIMQQATSVVRFGTRRLLWVDRAGRRTPVDSTWTFELSGSGNAGWSLSPDGSRLAIGLSTNSGDDIWVKRMPDGPASRLTFDTTSEVRPRWTPDGQSVVYVVNGQHVLRQRRADGTGETSTVLDAGKPVLEGQWSRDGRWLIARTGGENLRTGGRDIVGVEAGTGGKVRPLAADPAADESAAALSPDGRWLAYQSDETGRTEIYLRPFPGTGEGKWQVSLEGGHSPLWAHSGRELFFLDASRNMMSVPVAGVGAPELGQRRVLFPMGADLYSNDPEYYTPFDIAPDDQRFLMAEAQHDFLGAHPRYVLVENWPEEVRSVMAAGR